MNGLGPSRRQVKAPGLTRSDRVTSVDEPAGLVVGRFFVQSSSTFVVLYTLKRRRNQTPRT
jgi:hypothetical protein